MMDKQLTIMEETSIIDQLYDRLVKALGAPENRNKSDLELLTRDEVADLLHTTTQNVAMLHDVGVIKPIRIGKNYLTPRSELLEFYSNYRGYDVSNRVRAMKAKEAVENGN